MATATRDSNYWQGRLDREHPAIAERLRSGEIPSVRAAAIEAGLIRERTPLADLRRAWARAAQDERQAFLAEVGLAGPPVVDHDRLAKMSEREVEGEAIINAEIIPEGFVVPEGHEFLRMQDGRAVIRNKRGEEFIQDQS